MLRKTVTGIIALILSLGLIACGGGKSTGNTMNESSTKSEDKDEKSSSYSETETEIEETSEQSIVFKINDSIVDVFWMDNDSVEALRKLAKDGLTIKMSIYGDFEQVGSLGTTIPSNDERITTMPGDICLYQSNQIVVFYGSNTWEYTKLGHISMGKLELIDLLGDSDVTVTISLT